MLSHYCMLLIAHVLRASEPERQYALLQRHMDNLREIEMLRNSKFIVMVERNLGFEAEHHERHFNGQLNVHFRVDHKAERFGILTTEEIKYAMCTLLNSMLREQRVCIYQDFVSERADDNLRRLREQLHVYSLQFKSAVNVFGKQRQALSGKVGGMKDDVVICLQLAIYFSKEVHMYA